MGKYLCIVIVALLTYSRYLLVLTKLTKANFIRSSIIFSVTKTPHGDYRGKLLNSEC